MPRKQDETWTEWMAAEAADDADRADAALRAALQQVRQHPGRLLSWRLMRAARVVSNDRPVRSEGLVAAGLVVLALVMTVLPVAVAAVLLVADAGRVVTWMARACVWLTDGLNAGVSIWAVLGTTGSAIGRAVSSPAAGGALTATLFVASSALIALNRFLTEERS
jgi:hypothetical protein